MPKLKAVTFKPKSGQISFQAPLELVEEHRIVRNKVKQIGGDAILNFDANMVASATKFFAEANTLLDQKLSQLNSATTPRKELESSENV